MPQEGSRLEKQISIQEALLASTQLQSDTARLDVECLLCHSMDCDSTFLRTWPEKTLTSEQYAHFQALLTRRINGEPIAHICGTRSFWTLDLFVTPDTLIPRPDTEVLVETILDLDLPKQANILDLGTGTGAIALALASERTEWKVSATDFSTEVVVLAQRNADKHQITNINIFKSDWFCDIPESRFDLIVSNPPYIEPGDKHLAEGDLRFEPLSALTAGNKGLADIEHIIAQAPMFLNQDGWLVLEHGYDQAQAIQTLFKRAGYCNIATIQDYGQQDRMTMAQYPLVMI
tara:strand:- start:288 stop:1157 length:870 start_codon:yes stop_codon:yes gene_type:complete